MVDHKENESSIYKVEVSCCGKGLYINSSKPSDLHKARRVLNQFNISPETCQNLDKFFETVNTALDKLMRAQ